MHQRRRTVQKSERGAVVMWWASFGPLVRIGLTDLPKTGGAIGLKNPHVIPKTKF